MSTVVSVWIHRPLRYRDDTHIAHEHIPSESWRPNVELHAGGH
ncbi:hypothetical protein [Mycobacterium sp.]|nr:hypothetical protein [Mycobacterium sp.]